MIHVVRGLPLVALNVLSRVSGCRGNDHVATDTLAVRTLLVAWDEQLWRDGVEILLGIPWRFGQLENKLWRKYLEVLSR